MSYGTENTPHAHRHAMALGLARAAGERARDWSARRADLAPSLKTPLDWVTKADGDVERFIRERIAQAFPADAIIGEEDGAQGDPTTGYAWVIDPIDGTGNFVLGLPFWCVSIGVFHDGMPALGVIQDPVHARTYHAVVGVGAWCDTDAIRISGRTGIEGATIAFGHQRKRPVVETYGPYTQLAEHGATFRTLGSGALQLALVAAGTFDGYFESEMALWDVAAAAVLVTEAGGFFTAPYDLTDPVRGFPVVAGTPGLREALEAATEARRP